MKESICLLIGIMALCVLRCEKKLPVVDTPIHPYQVDHHPAFFADSMGKNTIAYHHSAGDETGIFLCDFEKREPRLLISSPGYGISFSHDGYWITFSDQRIWKIKVNGDSLTQLVSDENGEAFFPNWSPDGTTIAYDIGLGPQKGIYLMDPNGGNKKWLLNGRDPAWSLEGNRLYYTGWTDSIATDTTYMEIYYFEFATSRKKRLTYLRRPWFTSECSVSPSGEKIAFTFQKERGELPQVWIIGNNGENARQITKQGGCNPVFCSEEEIIYAKLLWGYGRLWRIGINGENDTPLFDE
jgi:Tol biopolymer transport system component